MKASVDRHALVVLENGVTVGKQGIVLLDAFAGRLDFPASKMQAVELQDLWKPDYLLIENKGTGHPLIQELLGACNFRPGGQPASRQRQAYAN